MTNDVVYTCSILEALFKKNPKSALALFGKTKGMDGGAGISFVESALAANGAAVFEWASAFDFANSHALIFPTIGAFARKNPMAAVTLIKEQTDSQLARSMTCTLFAQMSGGAKNALQFGAINLPGDLGDYALLTIAGRYAAKSPEDALAALARSDDSFSSIKNNAYKSVFEGLFENDRESALQAMKALDSGALQSVFSSEGNLKNAISTDPASTVGLLDRIVMTSTNAEIFENASFHFAEKDPEMAFEWVGGFEKSKIKEDMMEATLRIWAQKDPTAARAAINNLPADEKVGALKGLATGWSAKSATSFQEAVDWSAGLAGGERSVFLGAGMSALAFDHTDEAVALLDQGMGDLIGPGNIDDVYYKVAQNLAGLKLEKAVTWVNGLPPDSQSGAVKGLMEKWVATDPPKASDWLSKLPPGAGRDAGARVLANEMEVSDPVLAKKWRDSVAK